MVNDNVIIKGDLAYFRLSNADGKIWLMPKTNTRIAMSLYQPSSVKGKLLKKLFPILNCFGIVNRLLHFETLNCFLHPNIEQIINEVFNTDKVEFSVFFGTPSARQKITIQVYKENHILGYIKVTENSEVFRLFEEETALLNYLKDCGVKNIPNPLKCCKLANMYVFIQDTTKGVNSLVLHKWSEMHSHFIEELFIKTVVLVPFEKTDFYSELSCLKKYLEDRNDGISSLIKSAIQKTIAYYSNESYFSCFHADFTPWNTYVENNKLYVFDFEYAKRTFPPYMDMVHFILQVLLLEKKCDTEKAYNGLEVYYVQFLKYVSNPNILILAYLVHIIAFYMHLYSGNFSVLDRNYNIWTGLIKKYISKV